MQALIGMKNCDRASSYTRQSHNIAYDKFSFYFNAVIAPLRMRYVK